MKTIELLIDGMSCGHCVMSVKKELSKLPGLTIKDVQPGIAQVEFEEGKLEESLLKNAVEEAGFTLIDQKEIG